MDPARFVAHQAGGAAAMRHAVEDAEDDREAGAEIAATLGRHDLVVGIAASGRTPFVEAARRAVREGGAYTALISSNPDAPLGALVDRHVCAPTGAEAVAGSTRMKAGTGEIKPIPGFADVTVNVRGCTRAGAQCPPAGRCHPARHRHPYPQVAEILDVIGDDPQNTVLAGDLNAAVEPDRRIDFILPSPDITVNSAEVVDSDAADHLPVLAAITATR